ncbi:MAG TPA: PAS domain-containing protein [Sediminispirochaeta sp.]|nr:PAS domain-containing protein [Sediminispirochaeta sp.]
MNLFSHLSFTAAVLYLLIGAFALLRGPRVFINRLFFSLSVVFFLWALANSIAIAAPSREAVWRTYHYFAWVFVLFPAPFLHFALRISNCCSQIRGWKVVLFYLPGLLIYLSSGFGVLLIADFTMTDYGWIIQYNRQSPWYYINIIYYSSYIALSLAGYLWWFRHTPSERERRKSLVIMLTLAIGFLLSSLFGTLAPFFGVYHLPPLAPVCMLVWISGVAYSMFKYQLLHPEPDITSLRILQHIHDMVLLFNIDGKLIYGNRSFEDMSGYQGSDFHRLNLAHLFPLLRERTSSPNIGMEKGTQYQTVLKTRTKEYIPVELIFSPLRDRHRDLVGYLCTAHDRRTMLKLEKEKELHEKTSLALKSSEQKFMTAFLQNPLGMALVDPETENFEMLNSSGKELFRVRGIHDYPRLRWAEEERHHAFFRQLREKGRVEAFPTQIIRANRATADIILSADRISTADSSYYLLYFLDHTYMKQMESELISMQKFETVALMAGGIAHDFNNMLTSIQGNINLTKQILSTAAKEPRELLSSAEQACNHASELTSKLLSFSKYSTPQRSSLDITKVIRECLQLSIRSDKITIKTAFTEELKPVFGDEIQLQQVFNNLFINAQQAMPQGGRLFVQAEPFDSGSSRRQQEELLGISPGEHIRVKVEDSGTGIEESKLPFLFDPYYSTKEEGTGLGLTVVYSILRKHGGGIRVESRVGEGTCFTLYLPCFDGSERGA